MESFLYFFSTCSFLWVKSFNWLTRINYLKMSERHAIEKIRHVPFDRIWHITSLSCIPHQTCVVTWWRHEMGTFSALLAICAGNSPVTAGQLRGALMFSLICVWINGWWSWQFNVVIKIQDSFYDCAGILLLITDTYALTHPTPWTKWPPFRGRHFQMHFHEWKVLYLYSDSTEVCS